MPTYIYNKPCKIKAIFFDGTMESLSKISYFLNFYKIRFSVDKIGALYHICIYNDKEFVIIYLNQFCYLVYDDSTMSSLVFQNSLEVIDRNTFESKYTLLQTIEK